MYTCTLDILKHRKLLTIPDAWPKIRAKLAKFVHTQPNSERRVRTTLEKHTHSMKTTAQPLREIKTLSSSLPKDTSPVPFKPLYGVITPQRYFLHNLRHSLFEDEFREMFGDTLNRPDDVESSPLFQLENLVDENQYPETAKLLGKLLEDSDGIPESLSKGIPIHLISNCLARGLRARATEDCLRVYDQVSKLIGVPSSLEHKTLVSPTPKEWVFYQDHQMTLQFVRNLVRLSRRKPSKLEGWYRAKLEENPKFFLETAARIYNAYAAVCGFGLSNSGNYEVEYRHLDVPSTSVAIACLFELGRCELARDVFAYLFDRWAQRADQVNSRRHENKTNPIGAYNNPNSTSTFSAKLMAGSDQPSVLFVRYGPVTLDTIFPSMARQDLDYAIRFLLEIAPARTPYIRPRSPLYGIVIHQSLKQRKLDEAFRVLEHAKTARAKNKPLKLGSTILDEFIQASLKNIRHSWEYESPGSGYYMNPNELKAKATKRALAFTRILDIFGRLGGKAQISTVHEAIEVALAVGQPRMAWEIRIWGDGLGLFNQREDPEVSIEKEKQEEQAREWKSSPQFIARGLLALHRRGFMEEVELRTKLDVLGVDLEFLNRVVTVEMEKAELSSLFSEPHVIY